MASDPGAGPTPTTPAPAADPLAGWQRLHGASVLVNLVPQGWRVLRGYWPLLLALFVGTRAGPSGLDLLLVPLVLVPPALRAVVHWATLRYRVHEGRLEIRSGLLHRRARIIGPERIQNCELVRNPFHRLAGLVELRLETAGGEDTEGLLSALSRPAAERLLARIEALQASTPGEPARSGPAVEALHSVGTLELLAHGLTSRRAGVLAVLIAVGLELWQQVEGQDPAALRAGLHPGFVLGMVLAAFAIGILLAVLDAVLRFHDFQLTESGGRLAVAAGLLTRRRVTLERRRVQFLRVDEPLLRRVMGYATVHLETAGLAAGPDGLRQAEATLPMVEREGLGRLCRALVPELDCDPWSDALTPAPLRALGLSAQGALARGLLLLAVGLATAGPWGLLALAAWPLLGVATWFDWRWQAWRVTPGAVVARRGFWIRRTTIVPRGKVQSTLLYAGPLLRPWGLARVWVRSAGSRMGMPALPAGDALRVLEISTRPPVPSGRRPG